MTKAELLKEIQQLKNYIVLAQSQYLGCGGRLSPKEIVNNMKEILQKALEECKV